MIMVPFDIYDFLLVFKCYYFSNLYRFGDIVIYICQNVRRSHEAAYALSRLV